MERVWAAAALLAMGGFVSLWVSRKIAGPLYRIERDLEAILSGTMENRPIQLRHGDHLQHLAALVNQLRERIR